MFLGKLSNNDNRPRKSNPNQNYMLRCVDTQPRAHPTETEQVITVVLNDMVVRITEQASFFEILWVMRVLRFIMNFSDIRAGLCGAGRVVCWVAFCGLVA